MVCPGYLIWRCTCQLSVTVVSQGRTATAGELALRAVVQLVVFLSGPLQDF